MEGGKKKSVYSDLNADDDEQQPTVIESLCIECMEEGETRLLFTKIPFYREVILSSFSCNHCGNSNNEIQSGGMVQDKGITYTLSVSTKQDMSRQIVISEYSTVSLPSLKFEIPPNRGSMTTVEGILEKAISGLQQEQPVRKVMHPELAEKIDKVTQQLTDFKDLNKSFQLVLDDPSGNSFIENPNAPKKDDALTFKHYTRNQEQEKCLGLVAETDVKEIELQAETDVKEIEGESIQAETDVKEIEGEKTTADEEADSDFKKEVLTFRDSCPRCATSCDSNMKMIDIPYFKEVIIMATVCDHCGYRDNEVKGGSGIEPKGRKITLKITDPSDLSRDILKSETAGVSIPELEMELEHGSLGGQFTTVEGLIKNIKDKLIETSPFYIGDSSETDKKNKFTEICDKLSKIENGETLNVHLILDDPAGNSYLQNTYAPDPDPELKVEEYERNFEQNETLGLNDMKTENY